MRARDERGVVYPSPVVMLSVIAVAMAGIAFVATRSPEPAERDVATVTKAEPSRTSGESATPSKPVATQRAHQPLKRKKKPAVQRGDVYVEVYNNSGITGLAGQVAAQAGAIGWQVVGADNWYGTIPGSTVYYPERLERAAKMLALDLGIQRVQPAIDPMRMDRLTVILTGPLA